MPVEVGKSVPPRNPVAPTNRAPLGHERGGVRHSTNRAPHLKRSRRSRGFLMYENFPFETDLFFAMSHVPHNAALHESGSGPSRRLLRRDKASAIGVNADG